MENRIIFATLTTARVPEKIVLLHPYLFANYIIKTNIL